MVLFFILIHAIAFASDLSDWQKAIRQPITQLTIATFIKSENSHLSEKERILKLVSLIEKSIIPSELLNVNSLESYKKLRNQSPIDLSTYWSEVSHRGIVTPLNIKTPNSAIYEQILEYEIHELDESLGSLKNLPVSLPDINEILSLSEVLIKIYKMGLTFRDILDNKTKSWTDIPGLNLLRKFGENIVNPAVRQIIYSDAVINQIRREAQKSISELKHKIMTDYQNMKTTAKESAQKWLDSEVEKQLANSDLFKTFKNLNSENLFALVDSFFNSLPTETKESLIWKGFQQSEILLNKINGNSADSLNTFILEYLKLNPQIISYFIRWMEAPDIQEKIRSLSRLPIHEITLTFAKILQTILKEPVNIHEPKLIGESYYRYQFGFSKTHFSFYLTPAYDSSKLNTTENTFSVEDFISQHPEYENFIKVRIAQAWIKASFNDGLPLIIDSKIHVQFKSKKEPIKIFIHALEHNQVITETLVEDPQRIIDFISELPLRTLTQNLQPSLANLINTYDSEKIMIDHFLKSPQNLQWLIQMHQLREIVGDKAFQRALLNHAVANPRWFFSFLHKKWQHRHSGKTTFQTKNSCLKFYL